MITVVHGTWAEMAALVSPLRREVFILEQAVPEALEWDTEDAGARHFAAVDADGMTVGCARVLNGHHVGRMAVSRHHRLRGTGALLLRACEAYARTCSQSRLTLHAQLQAAGFYRKQGYRSIGDEFMDAGIPHVTMEKRLAEPLAQTAV